MTEHTQNFSDTHGCHGAGAALKGIWMEWMKNVQSMDQGTLHKIHRNNAEAMANANRLAVQTLQSIARMQSDSMRGVFAEMDQMARKAVHGDDDTAQAKTEDWKHGIDRAMSDCVKMSDTIMQAQQQFIENAHRQFCKNAADMQECFKKPAKEH